MTRQARNRPRTWAVGHFGAEAALRRHLVRQTRRYLTKLIHYQYSSTVANHSTPSSRNLGAVKQHLPERLGGARHADSVGSIG